MQDSVPGDRFQRGQVYPVGPVQQGGSAPAMVDWGTARLLAHRAAAPLTPVTVRVDDAAGLTLAEAIRTRGPLPAFDTAAMDGFAVAGDGPWQRVGHLTAGSVWSEPLQSGTCIGISTGAQVPDQAFAVAPSETVVLLENSVLAPPQRVGRHIRRAGEDAAAGMVLAPAGSRIGPAMIGLIATCGYDSVVVRPAPRVCVLITGDELHDSGPSRGGMTRDALGPMMPALIQGLGGAVVELRYVSDRRGALETTLETCAAEAAFDVVVVTGSTSVGDTDALRPALRSMRAEFVVDRVACRPGRPQLLARAGTRWVVGLPGNPFAALVAAHTVAGPLLAGLTGRPLGRLPRIPVRGELPPFDRAATRLVPVAWHGPGAAIVGGHRAAFLRGAAMADGFVALPPSWIDGEAAPIVTSL